MTFKMKLKWKISLYSSLSVLLLGIILGFVLYKSSEDLIVNTLGNQAESLSKRAAEATDKKAFQEIYEKIGNGNLSRDETKDIVNSEAFQQINSLLNEYRVMNDVLYVYSMAFLENDELVYVVDGFPIAEGEFGNGVDDDSISPPGLLEDDEALVEGTKAVYESKKTVIGELTDSEDYGDLLTAYAPIFNEQGDVIGVVAVDLEGSHVLERLHQSAMNIVISMTVIILCAVIASILFGNWITKPLNRTVTQFERVKKGDLTVDFSIHSKDEFGRLGSSINETIGELNNMIQVIDETSEKLTTSSGAIQINTGDSSDIIDETIHKVERLKELLAEQLREMNSTAIVFENMNDRFVKMARKTSESTQLSDEVSKTAQKGKIQMEEVIVQMEHLQLFQSEYKEVVQELVQKSNEITSFIETISNLSAQTNLLALNASIEAARAGDAGRGFAVVAQEVKKLSVDTSQAVVHISSLVESMKESVENTVEKIQESSADITKSSNKVEDTSHTFLTIMDEVNEVISFMNELNENTQQLVSDTKKSIHSIQQLENLSKESNIVMETIQEDMNLQQRKMKKLEEETTGLSKISKLLSDLIKRFTIK